MSRHQYQNQNQNEYTCKGLQVVRRGSQIDLLLHGLAERIHPYDNLALKNNVVSIIPKTIMSIILISFSMISNCGYAYAATVEYFDHGIFLAATKNLAVIDFDDLSPGTKVLNGNEFASQGLMIVHRDGLPITIQNSEPFGGDAENFNSPPNAIGFTDAPIQNGAPDNYDFLFRAGTIAAGLWIGSVDILTEVQFLAANGSIIASESFTFEHEGIIGGGGLFDPNRIFYGIVSDQNIDRIRTIEPGGDLDGTLYDDIQFSAIPEPGCCALFMAVGLAAIIGVKQRFR